MSSAHIRTLNFIYKTQNLFYKKPISNNYLFAKNFLKNKINLSKIWVGYNFLFSKLFIKLKVKLKTQIMEN